MRNTANRTRSRAHRSSALPGPFFLAACAGLLIASSTESGHAADAPGRNREGNRLYAAGRYSEAEQAYRAAQAEAPGRPELLYNTGNALLKQKKHEPAIQSLKQAVNGGDRNLQASAWFNSGNALFESRRYKEAADAYTQSLRLVPADPDAKHNLELALRQQQQQQKNQQQDQSGQQQPQDQEQKQKGQGDSGGQQKNPTPDGKQPRQRPPDGREQDKPADPRATSAEGAEGSFTRERALQILDALKNQEMVEQKKLLEGRAKRKNAGRDW